MTTSPTANSERMQRNTAAGVAAGLASDTKADVMRTVEDGAIDQRLVELDREWDVERLLFTMSGLNALAGLALTRWFDRRWLAYPAIVAAFQVQHGIQGWCPPFALLRRLKIRTRREIDEERAALKALRGDFDMVGQDPERALEAAST